MIISNKPKLTKHILYARKLKCQQLIPVFDFKIIKFKKIFCIWYGAFNQYAFKANVPLLYTNIKPEIIT